MSVTRKSGNASGIIHDIIQDFPVDPRIIAAIPFHLCDAKGPMYYIPTTMYHLKNGNLEAAKRTAIISSDPNDSLYLSDDGKRVYWCNIAYDVTKDQFYEHLQVTYTLNGYTTRLQPIEYKDCYILEERKCLKL